MHAPLSHTLRASWNDGVVSSTRGLAPIEPPPRSSLECLREPTLNAFHFFPLSLFIIAFQKVDEVNYSPAEEIIQSLKVVSDGMVK